MKIAIIGSGISGLSVSYLLNSEHDITVFEKNDSLGGHSRTIDIQIDEGRVPVDTGFIVFNQRNYPHLTAMFKHLEVPIAKSDMSFGVSINDGWLEYGTKNSFDIFAQKRNLLRLPFWRLLYDILKFNRQAQATIKNTPPISLEACLNKIGLSDWFRQYYLLAMGSAIWSMPLSEMLTFPAQTFIRFFDNHGLLTVNDQPQWYTVRGGSKEYVKRLSQSLDNKVKLSCGAQEITRTEAGVTLLDTQGQSHHFDRVILACHTDEALKILQSPTTMEQDILGSIRYQANEIVLHSDTSFMPKRRKAWSSWVYLSEDREDQKNMVSLSYWMNNLQPLKTDMPVIVTLNPGRPPMPQKTYDRCILSHPIFDEKAISAQKNLPTIQGNLNTWYCGAWTKFGFHEDGLQSAVNIAKEMKVKIPWT